jgi:hypothetical protein
VSALVLGAPGIYREPERPDRAYAGVRLDVTGFVGIAPRGPVGEAIRVESWSEYRRRFGVFEGPGLLAYAVSAFFDQGGQRAYVVRVAPSADATDAIAVHELAGLGMAADAPPIRLSASNEGSWGNALRIRLEFEATRQFQVEEPPGDESDGRSPGEAELALPDGFTVPPGSLLRVRTPGTDDRQLRWVTAIEERESAGRRRHLARLDRPAIVRHEAAADRTTVAVVEGLLTIDDLDRRFARSEVHRRLGLHPDHPRWMSDVLRADSLLVHPVGPWQQAAVVPAGPLLPPASATLQSVGRDRHAAIGRDDFFDGPWEPLSERRYRGIHALLTVEEIGLVVVPDLLWAGILPSPPPVPEPGVAAPPVFVPCPSPSAPPAARRLPDPHGEHVDARTQEGLDDALWRQGELVALAEQARRFTVLLDVPPGLPVSRVTRWRARFDSRHAAAYHPWLRVSPADDERPGLVEVPPSAFAAGIIADRERRLGLPAGPANELARGAVGLTAGLTRTEHDLVHPLGINVFVAERDGMRLTAARTLSRDPAYRQLSVSRLMTMLRLTIERESQWMVFEPNNPSLWATVRFHLMAYLSVLYGQGAFAGATEDEAFFVHCDERLNPPSSRDAGRLVVEVGVAPAEPLEFIVLRIVRQVDGGVRVEERRD